MDEPVRDRWLAVNYAAAIFTSAFLLFQIQPLVSKYILPWFGGSPAVWTTCLLFFQTLLFAGYAYAHFTNSVLKVRTQAVVHGVFLVVAALFALFHVLPGSEWEPRGYVDPVLRIIVVLLVTIGLPYFVLSSTGPLLQAWFSRSFPGRSPYRLYALSNFGSLLALISYPLVFEPSLSVEQQAHLWGAGFLVFGVLCGYSAWRLWHGSDVVAPAATPSGVAADSFSPVEAATSPTWVQRFVWLAWPAFSSVVLLATTNHITADIAVMPFLWIVPLALYLITFIIAFDRPRWYKRTLTAIAVLVSIYVAAMLHDVGVGKIDSEELPKVGTVGLLLSRALGPEPPEFYVSTIAFLVANFVALFAMCMMCHGELYVQRPAPRYLTSYYLNIAAGGALGGAFVTLVAPQLFTTYYEWQLSLFLGSLLGIGFLLKTIVDLAFGDETTPPQLSRYAMLGAVVLLVFLPSAVLLLDLTEFLQPADVDAKVHTRNFFGTLAVIERNEEKPKFHHFYLKHGAITHGAQLVNRRHVATTYYSGITGIARTIDFYRRELGDHPMKVGVVGLGTGTLAAYIRGDDTVIFYDINPAVVKIAEDGRWFTFLADARARGAHCETHLGDARLTLRRELQNSPLRSGEGPSPNSPSRSGEGPGEGSRQSSGLESELASDLKGQQFHVLALDAFSGDAIPVHLLTIEAFKLYVAHLARPNPDSTAPPQTQHGALAVHISNRYIDLRPVVHAAAQQLGLSAISLENDDDTSSGTYSAEWVIVTANKDLIKDLSHFGKVLEPDSPSTLWTDNYSSLLKLLK